MNFQFSLKSMLKASVIAAATIYFTFRFYKLGIAYGGIAFCVGLVGFALSMMPELVDSILNRNHKEQ